MEQFRETLLNVWREACRHTEISESTANIAAILRNQVPLAEVMVRLFDRDKSRIETVAMGLADPTSPVPEVVTNCSSAQMKQLDTFFRADWSMVRVGSSSPDTIQSIVLPNGFTGEAIVGPLGKPDSLTGFLVLMCRKGEQFDSLHVETANALLEPFSVALENDHRLGEMAVLREAAEADKRSLLSRLGRKQLGDVIVGSESGLRSVIERVNLVAPADAPVLLLGETGTGKELVARSIHLKSNRSNGPFIRVNCGAIPSELIDSQLFGHERGSFTGATDTRKGWFERADGGTLFLDEIGELPLAAQVRFLRIIQEGWLERVGGQHPIKVDVRFVCATNQNLADMVTKGSFREDLWYRVNVFPIILPPLRERKEDIPALAGHFAERAAIRFNLPLLKPDEDDVRLLKAYPWPGNVRELATVMDRAAILGNGVKLETAKALGIDVPRSLRTALPAGNASIPLGKTGATPSLDDVVRSHIESVLAATHGRIEGPHGAAALLKINPNTLRARMRKLKIAWKAFRS